MIIAALLDLKDCVELHKAKKQLLRNAAQHKTNSGELYERLDGLPEWPAYEISLRSVVEAAEKFCANIHP
jgi:hypothetical protein